MTTTQPCTTLDCLPASPLQHTRLVNLRLPVRDLDDHLLAWLVTHHSCTQAQPSEVRLHQCVLTLVSSQSKKLLLC